MSVRSASGFNPFQQSRVVEENAKELLLKGDTDGALKEFERIFDLGLRAISMGNVIRDLPAARSPLSEEVKRLNALIYVMV